MYAEAAYTISWVGEGWLGAAPDGGLSCWVCDVVGGGGAGRTHSAEDLHVATATDTDLQSQQ